MTRNEFFFYTALAFGIVLAVVNLTSPKAALWEDRRGNIVGCQSADTNWTVVPMSDSRCTAAVEDGRWEVVFVP